MEVVGCVAIICMTTVAGLAIFFRGKNSPWSMLMNAEMAVQIERERAQVDLKQIELKMLKS